MDPLLELDVRLLIIRHGRQNVLAALASLGEQTTEEVEKAISVLENRTQQHSRPPRVTTTPITEYFKDRPELIPVVQTLASKYENKTFLPHLRDVRRFLDRRDLFTSVRLKSRSAALGQVLKVLAKMTSAEITELLKTSESSIGSDYAILAREIMNGEAVQNRRDAYEKKSEHL